MVVRQRPSRSRGRALEGIDDCGYAHEQGVAHCDLTLHNILDDGEVAKVIDFGLACPAEGSKLELLIAGNPDTIAPELRTSREVGLVAGQRAQCQIYNPLAADVFSAAVVMLQLLIGTVRSEAL